MRDVEVAAKTLPFSSLEMTIASKGRSSRAPAEPQWGWSGVHALREATSCVEELREIVGELPSRRSSTESIVAELREYGDRFLGDLIQDEFGPTRAERAAALRELITAVEELRSAVDSLSPAARQSVAHALAIDFEAADSPVDCFKEFEAEKEALEALAWAASDAREPLPPGEPGSDHDSIDRLHGVSERAALMLRSLDTTTDFNLLICSLALGRPQQADLANDEFELVGARIRRLALRLSEELGRLSSSKGPEPRVSLPLLVARLCDLWTRETGRRVTVNPYVRGEYKGAPRSEAGKFVSRVVEALAPEEARLETLMRESGRAAFPPLKSRLHWNAGAVHSAMRLYVKAQDSKAIRTNKRS
jgi:hypothetical protein